MLDATLNAETNVDHEPHQGSPDIVIGLPDENRIFFECAWVTPSGGATQDRVRYFIDWVRKQVLGRYPGMHLNLIVEPINRDAPVSAPPEHEWKSITRLPAWNAFIDALGTARRPAFDLDGERNLRIIVENRASGSTVFTSGPVLNTPQHPEDHPIYRAIREKAKQANRWRSQGGAYDPLILVIGADEGLTYIDPMGCGAVTLRQAVYSALLHKDVDTITRYNSAGSWPSRKPRPVKHQVRNWDLCGPRIRVNKSHLIGAVAVVLFKDSMEFLCARRCRQATVSIFPNPDPQASFCEDDLRRTTRCLDLNRVEYTSSRECWEFDPDPDTTVPASRSRKRGGTLVTGGGTLSMPAKFEIPATILHRILAGDLQANKAWASYSSDVGAKLGEALRLGREIVNVEFVPTSPLSREEPRVRIEFGPPQPALIRVPRAAREA